MDFFQYFILVTSATELLATFLVSSLSLKKHHKNPYDINQTNQEWGLMPPAPYSSMTI
jgi:hypothetical protein